MMQASIITMIIFPTEQFDDFLDFPFLLLHCFLYLFHKPNVDSHLSLDLPGLLRPVYTGDFCRGNLMQFLSR